MSAGSVPGVVAASFAAEPASGVPLVVPGGAVTTATATSTSGSREVGESKGVGIVSRGGDGKHDGLQLMNNLFCTRSHKEG